MLLAGKKQTAIAKQLSLSAGQINKFQKEIINDRVRWNKKPSVLEKYYPVILNEMSANHTIQHIYETLSAQKVALSYSTVARTVAYLKSLQEKALRKTKPGEEGRIFFIPLGKFRKSASVVHSSLFLLQLSYSQYSYGQLVKDSSFECFLNCHKKAFAFFKGVPSKIIMACTTSFNLEELNLHSKYNYFLYQHGSTLCPRSFCGHKTVCKKEISKIKKKCLSYMLSRKYNTLSKRLKEWVQTDINLQRHPISGNLVRSEFFIQEQAALLPYDETTP